jgi:hypothetical protein
LRRLAYDPTAPVAFVPAGHVTTPHFRRPVTNTPTTTSTVTGDTLSMPQDATPSDAEDAAAVSLRQQHLDELYNNPTSYYITDTDEGIAEIRKNDLWNDERINNAKTHSLMIHSLYGSAKIDHNAALRAPCVTLGHHYASLEPEIYLQHKFNINDLSNYPLDILDDNGFPRYSLFCVPSWSNNNEHRFPPLFQSSNIKFLTRFDAEDSYFPILPVTYIEGNEIVWIFEMRKICTYKSYLSKRHERYDLVPYDTTGRTPPDIMGPFHSAYD